MRAFSEAGFRRTQVADIAKYAGTALGTLYLYVPSKEALFVMALERSLGEDPQEAPVEQIELIETIRQKLAGALAFPQLVAATDGDMLPMPTAAAIFGEVWDAIEAFAPTIRLVERCAQDWPDLAALFYQSLRPTLLRRLATYLEMGAKEGILRRPPDFPLAARIIVETVAWFTMHRHGDADGRHYDAAAARAATLDALVHAYEK